MYRRYRYRRLTACESHVTMVSRGARSAVADKGPLMLADKLPCTGGQVDDAECARVRPISRFMRLSIGEERRRLSNGGDWQQRISAIRRGTSGCGLPKTRKHN